MYVRDFDDPDIEIAVKVVIVGNGGVGKSSMIQRYCRGTFTRSYKKTIGVDFLEKELRVQGEKVRLMLWDTAGQEEFDAITRSYYRGAQACVVTFSTTDRSSLLAVTRWITRIREECGKVPMVLVQNKIDLIQEAQINMSEVDKLASRLGLRVYRMSVKDDLNVGTVFQHLAEDYVTKVVDLDHVTPKTLSIGSVESDSSGDIVVVGGEDSPDGNQQERRRARRGQGKRVSFLSTEMDPCLEYLKNPVFNTLNHPSRFRAGRRPSHKSSCKNL